MLGSAALTKEPWEGGLDRESTLVLAPWGGDVLGICWDPSSSGGKKGDCICPLCAA